MNNMGLITRVQGQGTGGKKHGEKGKWPWKATEALQ